MELDGLGVVVSGLGVAALVVFGAVTSSHTTVAIVSGALASHSSSWAKIHVAPTAAMRLAVMGAQRRLRSHSPLAPWHARIISLPRYLVQSLQADQRRIRMNEVTTILAVGRPV
jgi:uncharacterized membrane protein